MSLRYTPEQIGKLIRQTRKNLGVTQRDLALTSGTGVRFVIDLGKGKVALGGLRKLVPLSQLVIGTDYPFLESAEEQGTPSDPQLEYWQTAAAL